MRLFWVKTPILLPSRLQAPRGINPHTGDSGVTAWVLHTHRTSRRKPSLCAFLYTGGGRGRSHTPEERNSGQGGRLSPWLPPVHFPQHLQITRMFPKPWASELEEEYEHAIDISIWLITNTKPDKVKDVKRFILHQEETSDKIAHSDAQLLGQLEL